MEVLVDRPFDYTVVAEGELAWLIVVCGTVAVFNVHVSRSRAEVEQLLSDDSQLNTLIEQVRENPGAF
jgi:hypothetical protein